MPLLALLAQCAVDLLTATIREWLGRGIAPAAQLRVIVDVYAIDACLTPVGFLVAMAAAGEPAAFVLILPLLALLAALAADRGARIREARRPARPAHRGARAARSRDPPDRRGLRLQARPRGADRHRAAHGGRGARRATSAARTSRAARDHSRPSRRRGRRGRELAAQQTGALRWREHGEHAAMAQPLTEARRCWSSRAAGGRSRRRSRRCSAIWRGRRRWRSRTPRCTTSCAGRRPSTS